MAQNKKLRDQAAEQAQYLGALNRKLDQLVARVAHIGETLAAVVSHLDEGVIEAKMEDMRKQRRLKHEEELAASVDFMVQNELAKAAPEDGVIGIDSFVVGNEVAPDGSSIRIQHEMRRLDQAGQARYLGKKVGDEVTAPGFPTKIVITAIYTIDMVKVQEFATRKKAEALAAAQAQAAAQTPTVAPKE